VLLVRSGESWPVGYHFERRAFRMTDRWRAWLDRAAPPSTLRRQGWRLARLAARALSQDGVGAAADVCAAGWRRFRLTGAWLPRPAPRPAPEAYAAWQAECTPLPAHPGTPAQRRGGPRVSFLGLLADAPQEVLIDGIESVRSQSSPDWTLSLLAVRPISRRLRRRLDRYARADSRIRLAAGVRWLPDGAAGEYVCLVNLQDPLAPEFVDAIGEQADAESRPDIVYFDEDRLSPDGATRTNPWFKPDWSPELMTSVNLLQHAAIRRPLALAPGALDLACIDEFERRCAEGAARIAHVARVLYHRRGSPRDRQRGTAPAPRRGPGGRISVVIPSRDRADLLERCLRSILDRSTYPDLEVIVVDTGSTAAQTLAVYRALEGDSRVRVLFDAAQPFNYSRASNLGAAAATGSLLLFLNNDTEALEPDWLEEMATWVSVAGVGAVGAKLLRPSGTIQHAGIVMGLGGHGSHIFEDCDESEDGPFGSANWVRNYQAVTGACLMTRRELFDRLGGFDEIYQLCYSDIDFCLRLGDAGYRVVYAPNARVRHHEGASRGYRVPPSDVMRASCQMIRRVGGGDPYFNPNLSYEHRRPALRGRGEPTPAAQVVRVMEAYGFVPTGAAVHAASIAEALPPPPAWPRAPGRAPGARSLRGARVLLVSHDLSLSGAPLLLAQLAARLARAGALPAVLAAEDGPARALYETAGTAVLVKPELGHLMVNVVPMAGLMSGVDLMIANTLVNWRAVHLSRAFDIPCVLWVHECGYGREIAAAHAPAAAALWCADHVVLPAARLLDVYGGFLRPGGATVLPYGLEEEWLQADDPAAAPPSGRVRVVHVGSVEPRKGQDVLLRAIASLEPPAREALDVVFVGRILRPDFMAELQRLAEGLPGVRFLGERPPAESLGCIRRADIFVLSSRDEVLPVSVLEAMSFGRAIVASDVGGVAEAIQSGVTGIIVPPEDDAALAAALTELARDPSARESLGRQAQLAFRARYTGETFGRAFLSVVEQLLAGDTRGVRAARW
jgi:glycosyltransferase involved in cell wall biosynthesis/GT2 family glycosyltransferase